MIGSEGQADGQWSPQTEQLVESMHMLQALRDPTRPDHGRAVSSLDEHVTNPSFVLIMMHVFSSGAQYQAQGLTPDLRQLAGLVIKNYVFPHLVRLPSNVQAMIKREVVRVLHDSIPDIRKTAAILAGKISESFPVATWADMMPPILQMLDLNLYASHPTVVEGSLEAVQRICEDSSLKLALDETNRPLETLIPRLLALLTCPEAGVRIGALSSYNSLLYLLSPGNYSSDSLRSRNSSFNDNSDESSGTGAGAGGEMRTFSPANISSPNSAMGNAAHPLIVHMNAFIQRLSTLATDSHPKVRTVVCQAITTISTHHVAVLDPYFNDICQFMLVALQDTEESVAIESCEFWGVLTEQADTKRAIMPFLRTLVEHLISRLYLTAEQMEQERIDEEEEDSGEKELNLRPIHHKVSSSGSSGGGGNGGGSGDSDDKENSELSAKWTLRKQAALLLDNVALSFPPHDILAAGLPKIQEFFQHPNVLVKESGMLALGALSTGCLDDMAQYIPQLFPFLLQNIQDPLPEMRCISCWVLSRYCCLFGDAGEQGALFYKQALAAFLTTMFDAKPKAQVAACSALCVLVENSFYVDDNSGAQSNVLSEHLPTIFTAIAKAFEAYGIKSGLILVDTIGTIADSVGQELRSPQYTQLYLPQLVQKFNDLDDLDMRMFPMLECLSSVLSAIGLEAQQYVLHIYSRCLRIVSTVLKAHSQHSQQQAALLAQASPGGATVVVAEQEDDGDLPSKDFAICALDVISALCEGLGGMFGTLVQNAQSREALYELMFVALADPLPELRQSGFSLSGELCKHAFSQLVDQAAASQILQRAIAGLHTDHPLVCNNAAWTIGELALQAGGEFLLPYVPRIMNSLITALQTAHLGDNIKTNLAVTLGRLAMVDTLEVAELADEYFADWCSVLELPCPTAERIHAYTGMLSILHLNPGVLLGNKTHIYSLLVALVAWPEVPPPDLRGRLREVLLGVRAHNTVLFDKVLLKFGLHYPVPALVQLYDLPM